MPIHQVNGDKWAWGDGHGTFDSRAGAERQERAARANGWTGKTFDEVLARGIELSSRVANARRYVADPNDAPEGVNVEEGEHGGHYYETEGRSSGAEKPLTAFLSADERKKYAKTKHPSVKKFLEDVARERQKTGDKPGKPMRPGAPPKQEAAPKRPAAKRGDRQNTAELEQATDDLKQLTLRINEGELQNPQELMDAARRVVDAYGEQQKFGWANPERSRLQSEQAAARTRFQHALELHQRWQNRLDYAQQKNVPGEELAAVQQRVEAAKNEAKQASHDYRRTAEAMRQHDTGSTSSRSQTDAAAVEHWTNLERQQTDRLRRLAELTQNRQSGVTLADLQKEGEILQQIRNRLHGAVGSADRGKRKLSNHEDSHGSTEHHHAGGQSPDDTLAEFQRVKAAWQQAKEQGDPAAKELYGQMGDLGRAVMAQRQQQREAPPQPEKPQRASPTRHARPGTPGAAGEQAAQGMIRPGMGRDELKQLYDRASDIGAVRRQHPNWKMQQAVQYRDGALRAIKAAWKAAGSQEQKGGVSIG